MYKILDNIKDGHATASKYDNDNLRFRTPNTVMIFSNQYPKTKQLSRDRCKIYNVNTDGLNNVTKIIMKIKKDGCNQHNTADLKQICTFIIDIE